MKRDRYGRMLYESQVIAAVCQYLESRKYRIEQRLSENESGHDIIAVAANGRRLYIEAKGETSSRLGSRRFGKPFTQNQCKTHVAMALLKVVRAIQEEKRGARVAIALPDTSVHRKLIESIDPAMSKLRIAVFFVSEYGHVDETGL